MYINSGIPPDFSSPRVFEPPDRSKQFFASLVKKVTEIETSYVRMSKPSSMLADGRKPLGYYMVVL